MTIRLIITDDHEMFRDGLVRYFKRQPGIEVVAEASSGDELLQKLRTLSADLLLLDINMPGLSGLQIISVIKTLYPDLPILMLSAHDDVPMVLSAMRAGASGFISKTCASPTLLEAVNEVMVSGKYLTQDMAEKLLYASVEKNPYDDEIKDSGGVIRLNGKSIQEWRNDCLTFYQEKANQENINIALDSKNKAVENENFDLSEKVRHFEQQNQGNEFD